MDEQYQVVLQPEAIEGLESAYRFIESDSPDNAGRWIAGLMAAIESLSAFPKRCPFAPENGAFDREIRQLLYGKRYNTYRILFTIEANTVHVVYVRHGAQEWIAPNDKV